MTGFRCTCSALFPQHEAAQKVWLEPETFWGMPEFREVYLPLCPHCGSESLTPVQLCLTCGEAEAADGCDDCDSCYARIEAGWDRLVERIKRSECSTKELT